MDAATPGQIKVEVKYGQLTPDYRRVHGTYTYSQDTPRAAGGGSVPLIIVVSQ